jgi:hypothetical protein
LACTTAEVGIELISAVQCQMSHSQYFVVETEEYAKLHEFFMPFQGISTAEFTPVRDLMALWLPTAEVLDDADIIPPTE